MGKSIVKANDDKNNAGGGSDKIFDSIEGIEGFAQPLAAKGDETRKNNDRNCGANAIKAGRKRAELLLTARGIRALKNKPVETGQNERAKRTPSGNA